MNLIDDYDFKIHHCLSDRNLADVITRNMNISDPEEEAQENMPEFPDRIRNIQDEGKGGKGRTECKELWKEINDKIQDGNVRDDSYYVGVLLEDQHGTGTKE